MQLVKTTSLSVLVAAMLYSCDPCRNLDCISSNYYGQFRILSAANGADLVFGTGRIYDKSKIKFYSLKGADTTFFDYKPVKFSSSGFDSILQVHFFPQTENAYMVLSNSDVDTLRISYKTYDTRCCGTITEISNFRVNNTIDIPVGPGVQEIKK